ncbi:MAG: hypothetical protein DME19_13390 [Verrucomicrobia bacterium]|nr:MAG: hypothetical protein DME19_13390 [Verrucomicrobiota bacterium]
MGELESLLLVLALIYLSECMVWVRRGALAFRRWWGKNYRILHPGGLLANPRGGLLPANPLPPLGTVFVAQPFPLSLSPDAAFAYSSTCLNPAGRPSQTAGCLRFEDIRDVAVEGRNVLVNGEIFLKSISAFSARHLADGLRRLRKLPKPERAEAIKGLIRDSLNAGNIAGILRDCGSRAGPIRILSNALFFYLFFVVVPFVWRFGFGRLGLWLLGGMLPQTITIALLPTAIRAPDILARHLLEQFHPLAIAQVLCPSDSFEHFARQVLLDLRYPLFPVCPTSDEAAVAVERGFRTAVREAVEKFIQCAGLRPEDLTAPRRPDEPANQSYCPRCGAQFVMREGRCADCGGRPLQSFKQIPTA